MHHVPPNSNCGLMVAERPFRQPSLRLKARDFNHPRWGPLKPACAQACPTDSIQFGPSSELKQRAQRRLVQLQGLGETRARLYGADETILGGLNSFYLLVDEPEVYGLPRNARLPTRNLAVSSLFSVAAALVMGIVGLVTLRKRRMDEPAEGRDA